MSHDTFLRMTDPERIMKSAVMDIKSMDIAKDGSLRPPGPRVIELDGDQDFIIRDDEDVLSPVSPNMEPEDVEEVGEGMGHMTHKGTHKSVEEQIAKVWSDEAREAALEARRARSGSIGEVGSTRRTRERDSMG